MREKENTAFTAAAIARGVIGPGLNSSLGIFFPSVATALGVGIGTLSLTVSVGALAGMLFMSTAARLFVTHSTRRVALLGVLLTCLSFAALSFGGHVWWWLLLAVPFGAGTVIPVNLLGPLLLREGKHNPGHTLGYMMALSGALAAVLQPALSALIARAGWRMAYAVGGLTSLALLLPCIFLLPSARSEEPHIEIAREEDRSKVIILFSFLAVIAAFNAFHQHLTACGLAAGHSGAEIGNALFLSMVGATIGGLLLGAVSGWLGAVPGGIAALLCGGASLVIFLFGVENLMLFHLACILHGMCSASIGITAQAIARERCGVVYPQVLARILQAVPLATVVATPLFGVIFDHTGSYEIAWWVLLLLLSMAAFSLIVTFRRRVHSAAM